MHDDRYAEYVAEARGYAWAAIDFGKVRIAGGNAFPVFAFATAYAEARQATDSHAASYAPSVQDAFVTWQATAGRTVLPDRS
jgi:hypothetical protein